MQVINQSDQQITSMHTVTSAKYGLRAASILLGLILSIGMTTIGMAQVSPNSLNTISNEFEIEDEIQDIADPQGDGITQADLEVQHNQDLGTDGQADKSPQLVPLIVAE